MRLLLDEMYPATIAEQLRARGHDVVSIHDPAYRRLEGSPDEEVFATENRALVTENVPDFRLLEAESLAHSEPTPGLVFTTNRQFPRGDPSTLGQLVVALDALLADRKALSTAIFLAPQRYRPTRSSIVR